MKFPLFVAFIFPFGFIPTVGVAADEIPECLSRDIAKIPFEDLHSAVQSAVANTDLSNCDLPLRISSILN